MRLRAVKCAGRTRRKPPNADVWCTFCWSGSIIDGTPLRTLPAHSWTSLWTTIFWTPRSWAPQASRMTLKPTTGATRWPPGVRSTCGGSVGARGALGGCLGRSWAALLLNLPNAQVLARFLAGGGVGPLPTQKPPFPLLSAPIAVLEAKKENRLRRDLGASSPDPPSSCTEAQFPCDIFFEVLWGFV